MSAAEAREEGWGMLGIPGQQVEESNPGLRGGS